MSARLPTRPNTARKGYTQKHVDIVRAWKRDPLAWALAIFGDNIYKAQQNRGVITADGLWRETGLPANASGLSDQQEDVLTDWGRLVGAKLDAAAGLPHDEELAAKVGMSIQSGMGTGKDTTAALINWHFMFNFSYPKVLVTANTGKQLNEVYWSELAKVRGWAKRMTEDSKSDLEANFTLQSETLFANLPDKELRGKRWFTSAITINTKGGPDQMGEAFSGRHEDNFLVILDEATGLAEAVFKPLERTLTGKLNVMFVIFNPTQTTGYAIRTQTTDRDKWICKQWSALDSPNVTRASIRNLAAYGKDSPDYRIGVLGLMPLSDANCLIPYPWIQAALEREDFDCANDPIMSSADVGGGGDKSVTGGRQGGNVPAPRTFNSKKTDEVADWVMEGMDQDAASVCFIDIIGLGRGVYDMVRRAGYKARPADSRNTPDDPERFVNRRAEVAWILRTQFEEGLISLQPPADPRDANDPMVRLLRELGAMKMEIVGGKMQLGGKKELRRLLGFSPDHFDWLLMTYWKPDHLFRKVSSGKAGKGVDFKGVFLR